MACFQEEKLFPFEKKATAINFIMLGGKFFTIGASFANELPEPMPIVFVSGLAFLGLLMSFAYPTKEQLSALD